MTKNKFNDKQKARIAGGLFLSAFLLYGIGSILLLEDQINLGAALILANSVSVVMIGVLLRPIIATTSTPIANSYLATRVIEGLLLGSGALLYLLASPGVDVEAWNTTLYRSGMLTLGIGSIGFCSWLLASQRIHTLLAKLGLVGYVLLASAMVAGFIGATTVETIFLVPGAIFELTFGILLLAKGLKQ